MQLDFSFLPRAEKALVACSGGGDSLALLLALHQAAYPCVAAHVNHALRGDESDGDQQFIAQICARLNIPFVARRLDFSGQKSSSQKTGEAELRAARYQALAEMAREYSCALVVTGHSADDVLETILLNWIRGATISGFAGIAPQRELARGVLLVRPMLGVTRAAARAFLVSHHWTWRDDSSNRSDKFLRNRVRNELLPLLTSLRGAASTQNLSLQSARAAQVQRDDLEFLNQAARRTLEELTICNDDELRILDGLKFRAAPVALQRRMLRLAARDLSDEARDMELEKIEVARRQIVENQKRAVWQWRKNLKVEWTGAASGNRIRLSRVS